MRIKLAVILAGICAAAFSQADRTYYKSIAVVPQYACIGGMRFDYEYNLIKSHWIQVCPQVFYHDATDGVFTSGYMSLKGAGLHVYHKMFLRKETPGCGPYMSYGIGYNTFNMTDIYNDEGLDENCITRIDAVTSNMLMGYQAVAFNKVIFDFYWGMGNRYSVRTYLLGHNSFNTTANDFGFSGNRFIMGFRMGFLF